MNAFIECSTTVFKRVTQDNISSPFVFQKAHNRVDKLGNGTQHFSYCDYMFSVQ